MDDWTLTQFAGDWRPAFEDLSRRFIAKFDDPRDSPIVGSPVLVGRCGRWSATGRCGTGALQTALHLAGVDANLAWARRADA